MEGEDSASISTSGEERVISGKHEKQMLPLEGVKTQLTRKTFSIQVKKSFLNTTNASTGKLITVSFMEKENTVNTRPSRIAMDIEESGKRKIENGGTGTTNNQGASNRARTSRVRHASEVKTPPLKNYHKLSKMNLLLPLTTSTDGAY
ncbi:uncharacterized protein LOC107867780 isoform X1 [Capsicum annuum]|uniref:uncharacterized protein LOC107867780 isoform X1 n=2 Tax=Capsicum annuum TaxID=4072 RepID=UPI0007BEF6A6|nr:uncharacterized protein LOC107867780 isoform X1 [Capsicum annuum]XP_047266270.1 uncharacterized protein LOC107867780 isoform X1 [Capsicum annuum]XP_047266271.1 uncharacterized protein LOC107867780 isoform X1 [Capsicum annuum]XP_047266272.1 uncharacterized protein LOC107867780 isoform X1 [Capsicum annuum]XP_047266273.1 uncharacterized protein LOC107867780 isoform X1 [Capsicum annuum]